jgi:copper(I)-binding protein
MKAFYALSALALLAACHRSAEAPIAGRAWVRLPAVAGAPAAGYLTLTGGRKANALVRVESALAGRIEMHESMGGGAMGAMATMKPLDRLDVPAGGTVRFAPAGKHLMLFGLDPAVKPGTAVPLRLGFADGTTAEAEAKTVAAGEDAPY